MASLFSLSLSLPLPPQAQRGWRRGGAIAIGKWGVEEGGGDWNKENGKIRKVTTPDPPSLNGGTLRMPSLWATMRGMGAHHDHAVGTKSGATL